MGILDHSRTWQIDTSASPSQCMNLFVETIGGRRGALLGSSWRVVRADRGEDLQAVATYGGRAGFAAAASAISRRSQQEEGAAIGSQMTFIVTEDDGRTTCRMAMTEVSKIYFFFTADARFFRSAMNRVARQLRTLDADLELVKT